MQLGSATFFEGTEKKVELTVEVSLPSFRERGEEYWSRIARASGAEVLSRIAGPLCEAYLLSESSLFVFDHKLVMITCGRTRLPSAVSELLKELPAETVEFLIYERKNEVFPRGQPSSFFDDAWELSQHLPGRAFQFGEDDDHHLYLFHLDRPFDGDAQDVTVEVLMYGIDPEVLERFHDSPGRDTASLRRRTGVDRILAGFELDDYLFEPRGYSLNAIRDDQYWTVHVTPDPLRSYVSFETNYRFTGDFEAVLGRVLETFLPRSFDVVTFDRGGDLGPLPGPYRLRSHVARDLTCGYRVSFLSFDRPYEGVREPIELPLAADSSNPE
jgi:S-adenosylmethionine decarboxylase